MPSLFLVSEADIQNTIITLDEDSSKHITGVLRMKVGEELLLTDGRGHKASAIIEDDHRKRCTVRVSEKTFEPQPEPQISIAISLIKNAARFEWFLEKATEIGISQIIPLLCERTEKEKARQERMQSIITSAMLQSQQVWMPVLQEPTAFNTLIKERSEEAKFIAHCLPENKRQLILANQLISTSANRIILIGPEGDFTPKEIEAAISAGFQPVALGNTRLRTETAGMVAAALLCNRS